MWNNRLLIAVLLAIVPAVWAQAPQDALAAVRTKSDLNDEDRGQIRNFIGERLTEVAGADKAVSRTASKALRDAFSGSDAFKQAYAVACGEAIGSAYKKADLEPATRLLTVLAALRALETRGPLLDALQDERVGVRGAAALGLRNLRPKIAAAGADIFNATVAALRDAGKKEKSRETLRAIYAALDFTDLTVPDQRAAAAAVLDVLEERAKLYAPRRDVAGLGADDAGLAIVLKQIKNLSDDDRRRLTMLTATMVRYAIEDYRSPTKHLTEVRERTSSPQLVEYRDGVERLVMTGEQVLTALLAPKKAPGVTDMMKKAKKTDMKIQWNEWVTLLKAAVNQDYSLVESADVDEAQEDEEPEAP